MGLSDFSHAKAQRRKEGGVFGFCLRVYCEWEGVCCQREPIRCLHFIIVGT